MVFVMVITFPLFLFISVSPKMTLVIPVSLLSFDSPIYSDVTFYCTLFNLQHKRSIVYIFAIDSSLTATVILSRPLSQSSQSLIALNNIVNQNP